MPAFSLVNRPPLPSGAASPGTRRSPTHPSPRGVHAGMTRFGGTLEPATLSRGITRPVSYYALFQGWLLLSQPPGCLCDSTSFPT